MDSAPPMGDGKILFPAVAVQQQQVAALVLDAAQAGTTHPDALRDFGHDPSP